MNRPSALVAFWLGFIPGLGHFYWNRAIRAVLYALCFFGPLALGFLLAVVTSDDDPLIICLISIPVWMISILDLLVTLLRHPAAQHLQSDPTETGSGKREPVDSNERFFTIILSFIPGLGHFQLGLMNRGIAFLAAFFGAVIMIGFVIVLTGNEGFFVFLGVLPIIWLYSMFDAIQLLNRKQRGEQLVDRSIFEELEESRETGRRSRILATLLAVFPGAGHMYLGLQRRGLQLMAAFLFTIYVLDLLYLSFFLFLIPLIWFFSFFDALQQISREGKGELRDEPIVDWLANHQKWLGVGLLALGAFYLFDQVVLRVIEELLPTWNISYWFHRYFQTTVVSILLIGGGLKLVWGTRRSSGEDSE
ncbi:hypothetical protein LOK74_13900 [Brevibacillus humidisoli]|uniref:DUF6677 family protein n=1 Tax=Brevibacillus humidisoli TaxID=2895522 RepID=UPI001E571203|nr:DUF6677 family protein [Brevibacillus humidisoli]UFJ39162.1 hypothetical protein LOK74_13900 [Brevibacillus humidisoli]